MSDEKKIVEAQSGPVNQFVQEIFARNVQVAEASTSAKELFQRFVQLFGPREAKKQWASIAAAIPDKGGASTGPRNQEMTRQLITFYHHWRYQFPDRPLEDFRKACAKALNSERQGEFGNSEAAIIKRLERLDKGQKPS